MLGQKSKLHCIMSLQNSIFSQKNTSGSCAGVEVKKVGLIGCGERRQTAKGLWKWLVINEWKEFKLGKRKTWTDYKLGKPRKTKEFAPVCGTWAPAIVQP